MSQFIDQVRIKVCSGDGGNGMVAWRREKYEPMGGPFGGNGGKGGSVYLEASPDMGTLLDFRYRVIFEAEHGARGGSKRKHGKDAECLIIKVPIGTVVLDAVPAGATVVIDGERTTLPATIRRKVGAQFKALVEKDGFESEPIVLVFPNDVFKRTVTLRKVSSESLVNVSSTSAEGRPVLPSRESRNKHTAARPRRSLYQDTPSDNPRFDLSAQ